jgi:hypothetical protein
MLCLCLHTSPVLQQQQRCANTHVMPTGEKMMTPEQIVQNYANNLSVLEADAQAQLNMSHLQNNGDNALDEDAKAQLKVMQKGVNIITTMFSPLMSKNQKSYLNSMYKPENVEQQVKNDLQSALTGARTLGVMCFSASLPISLYSTLSFSL